MPRVPCKCGKDFATEAGLKQHLRRRYCKYRPEVGDQPASEDANKCTYCPRSFNTHAGLRQHVRLAHPDEYNNELERVADEIGKDKDSSRWSDAELIAMAKHEIKYKGHFINRHLHSIFPFRTQEAIKSRRLKADYKELILSLITEGTVARDVEEELEEEAAAVINIEPNNGGNRCERCGGRIGGGSGSGDSGADNRASRGVDPRRGLVGSGFSANIATDHH
ncbi:Zinc finger, C2H2 type [Popillia japonica]|uniref:Zinc finger, C2H2 type n=1 Tax=Popillia japonica TaxID=7064 RepID=A0AAW1KJM0_POPJA